MRSIPSLRASDPELARAEAAFESKDFLGVMKVLEAYKAPTLTAGIWQRHLLGHAQVELGRPEEAWRLLEANYALLRERSSELGQDEIRLVARSLKKMGWLLRQQKEYVKAYAYHHVQYLYLRKYGSAEELHDAIISLDVDANLMGDHAISEQWLREGLALAAGIPDEPVRTKALAMTWNNLSDTLRVLQRWEEALQAVAESCRFWHQYDISQQPRDHREVWAIAQTAQIYGAWAQALASTRDASAQIEMARERTHAARQLADELKLNAAERADLDAQLRPWIISVPH